MVNDGKAVSGNGYRFLLPPNPLKGKLEYLAQSILRFSKAVFKK